MAAREVKDSKPEAEDSGEEVLVPFAFALAKSGEVVMLAKGPFDKSRFVVGKEGEANTIAHLRSIGFVGTAD